MKPAFQHLNLFHNPFGVISSEDRVRLARVDVDHLVTILQTPGSALQFVGAHGRGKTTHLLALHALLPEINYTQLHPDDCMVFERCDVRMIDSIENLSRESRKQLYQASGSLAVTTHRNLGTELKRNGYHVMTIKISTKDPLLLQDIFTSRIEDAKRGTGLVPQLSLNDIKFLQKKFGDDIRSMENYLYDIFQRLDAPQNLKLS